MVAMLTEKRYSPTQLARLLGVAPSTVCRWTTRGVRGVRLGTFKLGGRVYTNDPLCEEFFRAINPAANGADSVIKASSVAASDHAAEEKFLAEELG